MSDEFAELNSVLDSMDNNTSETEQDSATDNTTEDTSVDQETETTEDITEDTESSDADTSDTPETASTEDTAQSKGAKAFAAMRSENTQLKALVKRMAASLGLGDVKDDELDKAIENKLIADQAKANNIPEALQRKFQEQDNIIRAIAEERQKEQVVSAYTALQKECNLTNEQVYAFVQELQDKGYDMQKTLPHLADLYRGMHFQELSQNMVDAAVQKALARQQKSKEKSSTPSTKTGGTGDSGEKVDTIAGLDALLKDVKI